MRFLLMVVIAVRVLSTLVFRALLIGTRHVVDQRRHHHHRHRHRHLLVGHHESKNSS